MWPTKCLIRMYCFFLGRRVFHWLKFLDMTRNTSLPEIRAYQERAISACIDYAVQFVPAYVAYEGQVKGKEGFEKLKALPLVSKDELKASLQEFCSSNPAVRNKLCLDYTGGSTGQPLKFYYDEAYKDIRWATIYHNLLWAGYKMGDPHAFVYGSNADASRDYSSRMKSQDVIMNAFRINAFFLDRTSMASFVEECRLKRPKFLIGYASALNALAEYCESRSMYLNFAFIESTAEFLSSEIRTRIEHVFGCRVYDRYGCRELGNIGHECEEHNGLHVNWQVNYIEVINKGDYPTLGPRSGDLAITNFHNKGMPFLRYRVGDIGWIDETPCPCGMKSPRVFLAGARTGDLLFMPDGSTVSPLAMLFVYKDIAAIRRIQFIQNAIDEVEVKLVLKDPDANIESLLSERLGKVFGGQVKVTMKRVADIPKEISGKYRLTKRMF